jgi:hypothetical protein
MIGDIFRLAAVGEGAQGQQLVNVWHYRQETLTIFDEPGEDLAEAWNADLLTLYLATFSGGAAINTLQVRGVSDPTYGYDFDVAGHPVGTSGSGEELPPQNAAVVTWKTGLIGRSFRGRTYFWPMAEANQQRGSISAGYSAALQAFGDAARVIGDSIDTARWRMVIHSTVHNGVVRPEPVDTPVIQAVVRPLVCIQRRRKAGAGV